MKEVLALGFFALAILLCLVLNWSVIVALLIGLCGFVVYGLSQGYSLRSLYKMGKQGIGSATKVMIILLVIGMLTGSWRASGTIAYFVSIAIQVISPKFVLFWTFFLNALLSTVIGTSFGTAATMGVVGMTLCTASGINPILSGGAILSGIYVGDRWSPVSSSALFVATVTNTSLYRNVAGMMKTGFIPFLLACIIYFCIGYSLEVHEAHLDMAGIFSKVFVLSPWTLLPAVVLLGLLAFRINIIWTMCASVLTASLEVIWLQGFSIVVLLKSLVFGFSSTDTDVAKLLDGGGLISMVSVVVIIFISCSYAGIFEGTGLIEKLRHHVVRMAKATTPFASLAVTAIVTSMLTCNQLLSVLLTDQLCKPIIPNKEKRAIALEDTCILFPALIPWSVANAVPVATIGAPKACIVGAFFVMLVPLCRVIYSYLQKFNVVSPKTRRKSK